MQKGTILAAIAISMLVIGMASAQCNGNFGEYSGHPIPNMSVGSTQIYNWILVNYCNTSQQFYIKPLNFSNMSDSPLLAYSSVCTPTNLCTIPANGYYVVNITINVPLDAPISNVWSGYVTALVSSNYSGGGAAIGAGTTKFIKIRAVPSTTTTTTSTSSSTTTTTIRPAVTTVQTGGKETTVSTTTPTSSTICFLFCWTTTLSTTTIAQNGIQPVNETQPNNSTTINESISGRTLPKQNETALYVVIALFIVAIAVAGWYFFGRGTGGGL